LRIDYRAVLHTARRQPSHAELFTALEFSIQQHPIGRKLIDILY
jgi:hypothetical protein